MAAAAADSVLNINVGILGHVDSGKTSLVRALSTELSTAALDKNPQSQERGITLDLGFSAFLSDIPAQLAGNGYNKLQFTLVDCPGHASLIRTIIGGAQIIDMMILVIDIIKGIQTQTAECLVIGEITTDKMIVVLNKVDLLPEEGRDKAIEKASAKIKKVLASTKFASAPMITLSASPGGTGKLGAAAPVSVSSDGSKSQSDSVAGLVSLMRSTVSLPERNPKGAFLFAIDHCFPIKGQGTVLTGTVLAGSLKVNDTIELPALRQERKVKSIQMFKKPTQRITQGDRAGVCVTNLDAALVERGLAATPGSVPTIQSSLALVKRIRFFKGHLASEAKVHVTVGHTTVMATVVFFGARELAVRAIGNAGASAEARKAAEADATAAALVDSMNELGLAGSSTGTAAEDGPTLESAVSRRARAQGIPTLSYESFSMSGQEWEWQDELLGGRAGLAGGNAKEAPAAPAQGQAAAAAATVTQPQLDDLVYEWQWAALLFESPVQVPLGSMVIGSKLDSDVNANLCRIAFYGRLDTALPTNDVHELRKMNIYKRKVREGAVDKIESKPEGAGGAPGPLVILGKGLFKKETDMHQFTGLIVHTKHGQAGVIEGAFGKSGKFRVSFPRPDLHDPVAAALAQGKNPTELGLKATSGAKQGVPFPAAWPPIRAGDALYLRFRKYQYEPKEEGGSGKGAGAKKRILQ